MSYHNHLEDDQFVVSYELLKVLEWLIENEQDALKSMITTALAQGLREELSQRKSRDTQKQAERLQQTIIDFFGTLEALTAESLHEEDEQKNIQRLMIPAINHIDARQCDAHSVAVSIAKATAAVHNPVKQSPKEILCRELLKRWKPEKKPLLN